MTMPAVKIKIKDTLTLATAKKKYLQMEGKKYFDKVTWHPFFCCLLLLLFYTYCICRDQGKKLLKFLMSAHSSTRGVTQVPIQASCTSTLSMRHSAFYSAHTE
jgi:hypothetical protein